MKFIKLFGLTAIATAFAVAAIGAGSASAVTLCKANESTCATANRYPVGQEIHAVLKAGTKAILKAGPVTDECSSSLMFGHTTANNGTTLLGEIEEVTFGGPNGEGCTCPNQAAINLPWLAHVSSTGSGNGTMKVKSSGAGNPGGLVICPVAGSNTHCTYETKEATVTVTGGSPAVVKAKVPLSIIGGDFACFFGGSGEWTAEYEVLTPKPLFVSASP